MGMIIVTILQGFIGRDTYNTLALCLKYNMYSKDSNPHTISPPVLVNFSMLYKH